MTKHETVLPTLPSFAAHADGAERTTLLAGLTFVEASTTGWTARDLLLWLGSSAALFGWPGAPVSVSDPAIGTIALHPGSRVTASHVGRPEELPKLLTLARWKAVMTLRGLLSGDDGFLKGAIFKGRVQRDAKASSWLSRPRETDLLSDIVLSLFASDILAYREFHEDNLCVCDVCGRISYNPRSTSRGGCAEHLNGEVSSGVYDRSEAQALAPPPARMKR